MSRMRLAGIAVVVALGLAACDSSGGAGGSTGAAAGTGSGGASNAAGPAAMLPSQIAKSKTLVIGIENDGSSAMDSTGGSDVVGFDPDLIKALGIELGVSIQLKPAPFDSLVAGVQSGRYDLALGALGDTKSREQAVNFVDYLNIGLAVVVKKGNPDNVQGVGELCGKSVAVLTGGYPQSVMVPKLSAECAKAGKAAIHPLSFADVSSAVLAVQSGRADCLYDDTSTAGFLLKADGDEFETVGSSPTLARTGIAFAKGDTQLGQAIEAAVQALITSGEYATIAKRWDLSEVLLTKATINVALI